MTLRSDLIAARALIDTPEKWGKGRQCVAPKLPTLCALTAVASITMDGSSEDAVVDALTNALPEGFIGLLLAVADFNDASTTTHADVMSLFQRAVDNAGERE